MSVQDNSPIRSVQELEQEQLQYALGEQNVDQIYEGYRHNNQKLSELSMTKYKYLVERRANIIHPPLPMQLSEHQTRFISQQELNILDKSLLQTNKVQLFKSSHSQRKQLERSISQFVSYGPKDEILFQLGHNKSQLLLQQKMTEQTYSVQNRKLQLTKLPKIKSYPSKLNETGEQLIQNKKQQKNIESVVIDNVIPVHYLMWIDRFYGKWRPAMREGATFQQVQNKFYLYGGISSTPFNDINVWSNEWQNIEYNGEKPSYGRTNHCSGVYKRLIFIFGGEKPYDGQQKIRECLNDFRQFNTENNEFKIVRTSGDGIEGRRGASSAMIGKYIIIFGGINTKGKYLNDCYHMDCVTNRIMIAQIDNTNFFQQGIAFHTLIAVYNSNKYVQIYKSNHDQEEYNPKYKLEGLYLFGGENKSGNLFGQLYMLQVFQRPMTWIKVDHKGISPCPRYKHTANYVEKFNVIVVYGGISEDSQFLNDCHIFKIEYQAWCTVIMEHKEGRAGHCSVVDDHKLLIFGGYNVNGFVASDIEFLEVDSLIALKNTRFNDSIEKKQHTEQKQNITQKDDAKTKRIKEQIENLQFQNMKSFLPMPQNKKQVAINILARIKTKQEKDSPVLTIKDAIQVKEAEDSQRTPPPKLQNRSSTVRNLNIQQ